MVYALNGVIRKFDSSGPIVKTVRNEETTAVSPSKARSNIIFRTKKELGLLASAKLIFEGKIVEVA